MKEGIPHKATTNKRNKPFFSATPIQTKLSIGQPSDKYEQEADSMADKVMRMPQNGIQRKCSACEDESVQRKSGNSEKENIQTKPLMLKSMNGGGSSTSAFHSQLNSTKGGGTPLPTPTNNFMSNAFGTDFSNVRVHTGGSAVQMNQGLNAKAFTHGSDVYFNKGEYAPESSSGKHLLAHELTHVIQQKGKANGIQRKCDTKSALNYYANADGGKKIKWTSGLVKELFKVVGNANKGLYENAKSSGKIDSNFVLLVCKAQSILGLKGEKVDGKIGATTKGLWQKWKTGGEHGINYTRLLKDKKLEIGIAIGYGATKDPSINVADIKWAELKKVLEDKKYNLTLSSSGPGRKVYTGKRKYKVQGDNTAPAFDVDIKIEVVLPGYKKTKDKFSDFLTQKEITIYSGHARYGTGPDFDDKKSPAENFVIGVNSALHKAGRLKKGYDAKMRKLLKGKKNDLEALSKAGKFDPNLYQVWFFKACTSLNYLDEIRGGLVTDKAGNIKSKDNLRVMGTEKAVYPRGLGLIVKGLLEMQTMEQIVSALNEFEKEKVKKRKEKPKSNYYRAD